MARVEHRINLDSPTFPLLSELLGRTVIVRGSDQTHPATLATHIASDPPQLYYAHNVVPTPYGYKSIGYDPFITGTIYTDFITQVTVREASTGRIALLGFTKLGKVFVSTLASPAWTEITLSPVSSIRELSITFAYVRGITYIYFYRLGCYKYDFTLNQLVAVTLSGLNAANTYGIVTSNGYMLAYGVGNAVAWSSPVDATDFVPSLITGAGAGNLDGAMGETVAAVTTQEGIIFFNASNATAALYQANGRYPFAFSTVVGCGGLSDAKFASYTAIDTSAAYAYTTSGLQAVTVRGAEFVVPEVTEFLSGKRLEDFNENTLTLSTTTPANVIKKQVAWIADRYLIVSYGDELLTHAIILDTMLGRLGKLKIDHVSVFEFTLYDQTIYETPKKSIGILKADGTVLVVNSDIAANSSNGVMILGKYQYVRERLIQLQRVDVENVPDSNNFTLHVLSSLDGKTLQPAVAGYNTGNTGLSKTYSFHSTGINHSLLAKGNFNLVSGILSFNIAGKK